MTAQEKAQELLEQFSGYTHGYIGSSMLTNTHFEEAHVIRTKELAEISVRLVLSVIPMYTGELNPQWQYWNDVLEEIKRP